MSSLEVNMGLFEHKKSLGELQEEDEQLTSEVSIAEKRALIKKMKMEYGESATKDFSDNGKASGFNVSRALHWLKHH